MSKPDEPVIKGWKEPEELKRRHSKKDVVMKALLEHPGQWGEVDISTQTAYAIAKNNAGFEVVTRQSNGESKRRVYMRAVPDEETTVS